MTRAELIELSDERGLSLALRLAAWSDGYRAGHVAGVEDGRRAEAAERDEAWNRIAAAVRGPSFAEVEARRWGPGGRERFADPRPGDYPGRQHV